MKENPKDMCNSKMNLKSYITQTFCEWEPSPPEVVARSKYDVTLCWENPELAFLAGDLLYRVERKNKIPPWVVEYCGGKTTKKIENLEPYCPHKFRVRVIIKADAVDHLADRAIHYYGSETNGFQALRNGLFKDIHVSEAKTQNGSGDTKHTDVVNKGDVVIDEKDDIPIEGNSNNKRAYKTNQNKKWLESKWSDVTCTSTESIGTSAICFCMAVKGGYLKHVQSMLDERPELVGIINNTSGCTPLATAARVGDVNMVKLLVSAGAEVDQRCSTGQTALHIAVISGHRALVDLLLEKGADFQARDKNDLRVEHYAVDAGDLEMVRHVLDRGGDVTVLDNNCWTPLFRAIVEGAPTAIIEELVARGSVVNIIDRVGLPLQTAARLLNRHGKPRLSVTRLVNGRFPRETALANFTRLTKKISSVHSLLKPASPCKGLNK